MDIGSSADDLIPVHMQTPCCAAGMAVLGRKPAAKENDNATLVLREHGKWLLLDPTLE